jgi:hypothetical protein
MEWQPPVGGTASYFWPEPSRAVPTQTGPPSWQLHLCIACSWWIWTTSWYHHQEGTLCISNLSGNNCTLKMPPQQQDQPLHHPPCAMNVMPSPFQPTFHAPHSGYCPSVSLAAKLSEANSDQHLPVPPVQDQAPPAHLFGPPHSSTCSSSCSFYCCGW